MKTYTITLTKKTAIWATGIVAAFLLLSLIAFKVVTTLSNPTILGTTTVSVSVVCDTNCTNLVDEVINDTTGQPVPPDANDEYNVTDPDATINTTIRGAARLIVTLTNSAYPAPTGVELFNQIFSSGDPAFDGAGATFEILPNSELAQYLQLGRNVFDFYVTSSIDSSQDIHRQLIINYTLPDQPAPEIIDSKLANRDDGNLPYKDGSTDYVAANKDLPLHVDLNAKNINRVQLTVTDSNGAISTVYDGAPLAADPATGYATYDIYGAVGNMPGLKVGRNVIILTVTGLNGETLTREWVVYYWPNGVEPPSTGVFQIGGLTVAKSDFLVSIVIITVAAAIWIAVIAGKRKNEHKKPKKPRKSKNKK